jgi:hypothetical protein
MIFRLTWLQSLSVAYGRLLVGNRVRRKVVERRPRRCYPVYVELCARPEPGFIKGLDTVIMALPLIQVERTPAS